MGAESRSAEQARRELQGLARASHSQRWPWWQNDPMSISQGRKRVVHEGSTTVRLAWEDLVEIFDVLFGADLDGQASVNGSAHASWRSSAGITYDVVQLDELKRPYESGETHQVFFHGGSFGGEYRDFDYIPAGPRYWSRVAVESDPARASSLVEVCRTLFPDPPSDSLVFLSWGGQPSLEVARVLRDLLRNRMPTAEVFLSDESIEPGDDPSRRMLEEGLLKATVLVAALTADAAARPWVIWETASAWAREQLVVPIFIDIEPKDVPGPLTARVQGVHLANRSKLDQAIAIIATRVGAKPPAPLTDVDYERLRAAVGPA